MEKQEIIAAVKTFIATEIAEEEASDELDESTELISGGILNSLATLQLVTFLEDTYDIEIKAREVGIDHMNTLGDIAELVISKKQ